MAVTASECEEMIRATRDANVKLMIAYRLHFERANLEAAKLARTGKLGELRFFSSDFSMQVSDDNIRLNPSEKGGGPLYDIGIYCINAARYCFAEDPIEVWATAHAQRAIAASATSMKPSQRHALQGRAAGDLHVQLRRADRSVYSITGTKGSVTLDPAYEYADGLAYRAEGRRARAKKKFGKSDQFAPELLYFSDCILKDREPEPSGEEGLADVRIIEGMLQSIPNGRPVRARDAPAQAAADAAAGNSQPAVPREPKLVDVKPASQ